MEKIELPNEKFYRIILNPETDDCPICGKHLKDIGFSWASDFHGHAKSSCCGSHYQILSYWVDKEKYPEQQKFAESLNPDTKIELIGVPKIPDMIKKFEELTEKSAKKK